MNSEISNLVNFLFEWRVLKYVPRAGLNFLKGPIKENLAEHTLYTVIIAWILTKLEKADESKTIKMALIHDLAEVRGGDRELMNKIVDHPRGAVKFFRETLPRRRRIAPHERPGEAQHHVEPDFISRPLTHGGEFGLSPVGSGVLDREGNLRPKSVRHQLR